MRISMSGYRTIFLLLWFFGARIPHEIDGVMVSVVVGGFTSQVECEQYRRQAIDAVKLAGGEITDKCISKEVL